MNLRKLLGTHMIEIPCVAVVKNPEPYGGMFRLGTPVTVDKKEYSKKPDTATPIVVTVLFPQVITNRRNFENPVVSTKDIELTLLPPLNEITQYVTVEHFTLETFSEVKCNLLKNLCTIVQVESQIHLDSILKILTNSFKLSIMQGEVLDTFNIIELESEGDALDTYVYFLPPEYTIPIFNRRKVDGCGVIIKQIPRKANIHADKILERYSVFFLFSNYEENFLVLDGARIRSYKELGASNIRDVNSRLMTPPKIKVPSVPEIKIPDPEKKIKAKPRQKKVKEEEERNGNEVDKEKMNMMWTMMTQ